MYGPFSEAITGPLNPKQQQDDSKIGYGGTAATLAQFANAFISGAQRGQRTKFEKSEQAKQQNEKNFDSVFAHIQSDPTISQEGKDIAHKQYLTAKYSQVQEGLKGADKEHKDNPIIGLAKSITGAVLGPNADKNHKDLGIDVNSLLSIATDPKYKIDPHSVGTIESVLGAAKQAPPAGPQSAQSPTGGQPAQTGQQTGQQPGFNLPGAPTAAPLQSDQKPAQATPPPPGTTAASVQAPKSGATWATQQEALEDPRVLKSLDDAHKANVDWAQTPIGRVVGALPKTGTTKPQGGTFTMVDPQDPKKNVIAQRVFDPTTAKTTIEILGEAKASNPTTTAEKRKQLVDDYKALGMSEEAANKKVAELDTQAVELKTKPKLNDEDKLTQYLTDSGAAKTPDEAKKTAATMLLDLEKAKIKATQHRATTSTGGGGGATFSPQELDALASWSIATGGQPSFGMGANNPNRTAFQKAFANKLSGEGIGDALEAKTDFKSLSSSLTNMQKLKSTLGSFEGSANKALDNALEASKNVQRDSSAMVNGWDQWVTKHAVDDPALQQLFVYTETAANEYARVIGSLTGASTNDARAQANSFIRSQLGDKSFQGAAQAMKVDMKNRTDQIDETIKGLRSSITQIGSKSAGTAPPPKQDDPIDKSKTSIKVGEKTINVGDLYKGKKILGFTKDGHLVTE